MAITASVVDFLRAQKIPYTPVRHRLAYTAQEEAALAHVRGCHWAKTIVCFADDRPVQAILPAHLRIDLELLRALAGARTIRLATEDELAVLYPECEVGAMPPFGHLYGHPVFVDASLVGDPEMVFNAGTHTDAICMHYNDFAEFENPTVGRFGCRFQP